MIKLTTKADIELLVEEASEMFEETGCVPDVDGKKVRAEKIVPRAKRYILMRRTRSPCCARAARGHAAALPSSVMNSRLFIDRTAFDPTSQG